MPLQKRNKQVQIEDKQRLWLEVLFLPIFEHCKTLKCPVGGSGCIIPCKKAAHLTIDTLNSDYIQWY